MNPSTMRNAISSTMKVPLGTRKLLVAIIVGLLHGVGCDAPHRMALGRSYFL